MVQTYSSEFILSLKDQYQTKFDELNEFVCMYNELVSQDIVKPLFSQTYKYDLFPKKKAYTKFRSTSNDVWVPTIPKNNIEKIQKTIKVILNKVTEKNYNTLIETLICEIGKFQTSDILDILAREIMNKIVFDVNFHNIYIKLCNRIWSMKSWHNELITIVIDDNNKLYWHKNTSEEEESKLNGPFDNEEDIRNYTNKYINFRYILLNNLYQKFMKKNDYIEKSNKKDIDEDERCRLRRNLFSIVEFTGKLYKKNMISEKIIHIMFIDLLNIHQKYEKLLPEYIEIFCILWKITNEKIISPIKPNLIQEYFEYINKNIMTQNWSLRIKFMLEDCINRYEKKFSKKNYKNSKSSKNTKNIQKIYFDSNHQNCDSNKSSPRSISSDDNMNNMNNIDEDFDKIENIICKFKKSYDYENTSSKLKDYDKYEKDILDMLIYYSIEERENINKYIKLFEKCKYSHDNIIFAVKRTLDNIDEILLDIPNAKNHFLELIRSMNKYLDISLSNNVIKSCILLLSVD